MANPVSALPRPPRALERKNKKNKTHVSVQDYSIYDRLRNAAFEFALLKPKKRAVKGKKEKRKRA